MLRKIAATMLTFSADDEITELADSPSEVNYQPLLCHSLLIHT